jgi:hypothetical protein
MLFCLRIEGLNGDFRQTNNAKILGVSGRTSIATLIVKLNNLHPKMEAANET